MGTEKKLPEHILRAVRQNMGYEETDTSHDEQIHQMGPMEVMGYWFGWHFGDRRWVYNIIPVWDDIKKCCKGVD